MLPTRFLTLLLFVVLRNDFFPSSRLQFKKLLSLFSLKLGDNAFVVASAPRYTRWQDVGLIVAIVRKLSSVSVVQLSRRFIVVDLHFLYFKGKLFILEQLLVMVAVINPRRLLN